MRARWVAQSVALIYCATGWWLSLKALASSAPALEPSLRWLAIRQLPGVQYLEFRELTDFARHSLQSSAWALTLLGIHAVLAMAYSSIASHSRGVNITPATSSGTPVHRFWWVLVLYACVANMLMGAAAYLVQRP